MNNPEPVIRVKNIVKSYGKLKAVNDVSFDVGRNEFFGFLGPNGAGKTTTIKMLCTLLKPDSGISEIDGFDTKKNPSEVRNMIGLVFQDQTLDEELTAEENLKFHANLYGLDSMTAKERIIQVLNMVELETRRKQLVKIFSGGMKRRLEIARGLLHYPKVLFLDEPTIGLDPQTRKHIWEYITKLKEEEKITVFLTTHYMDEAENCDRIAVMDHGRIIALDSPAGLKDQVGGDVIVAKLTDEKDMIQKISDKYQVEVQEFQDSVRFEIRNGEEFIPRFVSDFSGKIKAISIHRPTLNDVFIHLTGYEIRESEAGAAERMRNRRKIHRGHR